MSEIKCPHCGNKIKGVVDYKKITKMGGQATLKKYGKEYFKKIRKLSSGNTKKKLSTP